MADVFDRWILPPDPPPIDLEITAMCGAQVILVRAALLGVLGPERTHALAETLSPSAAMLLHAAPAPEAWVSLRDVKEILRESGALETLIESGSLIRLIAERDAGCMPRFAPPGGKSLLPGDSPQDFLMAIDAIYKTHRIGGSARLDALEAKEAWVSFWVHECLPGWASRTMTEWFKRILEDHYKVQSAITYIEPPKDRNWWHRYHLRWF